MSSVHRPRGLRALAFLLAALMLTATTGCTAVVDRLGDTLYPTTSPSPAEAAGHTTTISTPATRATPQPTHAPTRTQASQPILAPTAAPPPEGGQHLVFCRGGSIFRGGLLGEEAIEVASVLPLDSWDFRQGLLAMVQASNLDIVDLRSGSLASFQTEAEAEIQYAEVIWGTEETALVHAAVVSDPESPVFQRSVELRALSAQDGHELGKVIVRDVTGVNLLRYDQELGQVVLVPRGGDPSFAQVRYYDVESGDLVREDAVAGEGVALLSPDGRYLLTERLTAEATHLVIYDLEAEGQPEPKSWQPPQAAHSAWQVWSPDGRFVAFLLREGKASWDESTRGLGLWLLEVSSMQATQILEEGGVSSSLVGWTPDGSYILGYHRGEAEDSYHYAVRPDGGDRRILTISRDAEILGWMPYAGDVVAPKVVMDPWRVRFVQGMGDTVMTAQVVAQLASQRPDADDEALSNTVREYMKQAGWVFDVAGPSLKRVSDDTYVAQLPPMEIHVLESGQAQRVATGDLVLDARRESDDLALVLAVIGASGVQPGFMLLRRQADGTWQPLWTPQGQLDWIVTDGEINFTKGGLERLEVIGFSFGLDQGEDQVFSECHACPHRRLVATWVREGDVYARQTDLPPDAPLHQVLWEMTERSPYAILYECLWRLRHGQSVEELVADESVTAQIEEAGLHEPGLRLMAEEEMVDGVRFTDVQSHSRFQATIQGGRILHIERLND